MKPHLPLSLRRVLMKSLLRGVQRTLCSGSLMLTGLFLWYGAPAGAAEDGTTATTCIQPLAGNEGDKANANEALPAGEEEENAQDEENDEDTQELGFTSRFLYGMEELLTVAKALDEKGTEIKIWSPAAQEELIRLWRIHIYMPSTPLLLVGGTYEACYGPWPLPNTTTATLPSTTAPDKAIAAVTLSKQAAEDESDTKLTTAVEQETEADEEPEQEQQTQNAESYTSTGADNPSRAFAEQSMARMSTGYGMRTLAAARSVSTSLSLAATEEEESAAQTPAAVATDDTLVWTGSAGSAWDTTSRNWTLNGSTTTFSGGDAVLFGTTGNNRDINVTAARTAENMTITGAGYSFSGGGAITVTDTLSIRADGNTAFSYSVSAGTLALASEVNTQTTFSSSVSATTLTIGNGTVDSEYAGSYVFIAPADK